MSAATEEVKPMRERAIALSCGGSGIFHPHLPLECPVCKGTGLRKSSK